jgi:hypothetical protein
LADARTGGPVTLAGNDSRKALVFFQNEQVAKAYIRERGLVGLVPRRLGYTELYNLYRFAVLHRFTTVVKWWSTGDGGIVSEEEPLIPE